MSFTVAIDPGLTGAIAIYDALDLVDVIDMPITRHLGWKHNLPDAGELYCIIEASGGYFASIGDVTVVLETIAPRPGNGMMQVAASAASWGVLLGACNEYPVRLVTPQAWTKALGVGSDKTVHRNAAKSLWPGCTWFDRVKDDGRADAALIGWYWLTKRAGK